MVKHRKKRTRRSAAVFWVIVILAIGAFSIAWWVWPGLYTVSPEFYYIVIEKNDQPLKLLKGETCHLHPQDKVRILKVSTNITFNIGVRLVSTDFDINALSYEKLPIASLLPSRSVLHRYQFRVNVKKYNRDLGYVDFVIEPSVEDWLEKAERTIKPDRKLKLLEEAHKFAPNDMRVTEELIRQYKALKKWPQAAALLEQLAKNKTDQKVLFELLEVYRAMGNAAKSASMLQKLVKLNPDNLDLWFQLADLYEKQGKLKQEIKVYEALLPRVPKKRRLDLYKTLGYLYSKTHQTDKAISMYLKAEAMDKKDVNLYYNLATLYEKKGNKEKADLFLSKAVNLRPGDINSRIKLAESLVKKGRLKEADKQLSQVLKKKPNSVKALLLTMKILEKQGDKTRLKGIYRKLLSIDPNNDVIIYNLAVLEYETNYITRSIPYFKKYLKKHPRDIETHRFLFDIYRRKKQSDLALKEAKTIISLNPKETDLYPYIFDSLNKKGDYKTIIRIIKKGLKANPGKVELREYLVVAYLKTKQTELAIDQMVQILKARPKDAKLRLQLAKLQEKQGHTQDAIDSYRKVLDLLPGNTEANKSYVRLLLQVARRQEREGNFGEALDAYKKILDVSPEQEEAQEAYLRLRIKVLPLEKK